jgi:hypothetical protein
LNPKFYQHVNKRLPVTPLLSQNNPVRAPSYFSNFEVVLCIMFPRNILSKAPLRYKFHMLISTMILALTTPPPPSTCWGLQFIQLLIIQLRISPFFVGPNVLVSTLFSDTHSLCSFLSRRDKVSCRYKTTGEKYGFKFQSLYFRNSFFN